MTSFRVRRRNTAVPHQHFRYPETGNCKPVREDGLLLGLALMCVVMLAVMTAGVPCTRVSLGLVVAGSLVAGRLVAWMAGRRG